MLQIFLWRLKTMIVSIVLYVNVHKIDVNIADKGVSRSMQTSTFLP